MPQQPSQADQQNQQEPANENGVNRSPQNVLQQRENGAYVRALTYARKHYTPEAHIVSLVDRTRARPAGADPHQAEGTLWHALITLEDGRHAVVGARYDERRDEWEAFEVGPPTLGDPRGISPA